jgi:hypothetical protein
VSAVRYELGLKRQLSFLHRYVRLETPGMDFEGISIVKSPANDISIMIDYKFVAKLQRNRMVCVRKFRVFRWKIFAT